MRKHDDFKLNVLSAMDDEIVDRNTQKRYRLLSQMAIRKAKNLRRLFWSLGGVAASLTVVLVGVLIAQLLIKQVPVYQGMSISSMESGPSLLAGEGRTVLPISYLGDHGPSAGGYRDHNQSIDQSKPFGEGASAPVEEEAADSLKVEGAADKIYYAKPNEEIYITIHISNPDSYEILSFTLNGKKYSSYMFEDGSDMENLILKVNVGEVEGIVEYTIDAIKYVDGTQIKDVRMEGDQTVRAGVATDKQPVAQISGETVGLYDFRLNVTVSDPLSLIERSLGEIWAVLYDGEQLVGMQQLEIGKTESVIFDGLSDSTVYQYAVVAYYDALDGTGIHYYALAKKAFCTRTVLAFDSITVAQERISFACAWDQAINHKALTSVQLYQNGALVREIDRDATAVDGLLSNTEYTLVVHFKNKGADDTVELVFRTAAKATPVVAIVDPTKTQTSVGFGINVTDPDQVGAITKIELLHGEDTPVVAENTGVRAFNGLLSNNTYTVRVTYTYDLNDGKGAQTSVKTLEIKTEAKATPVVAIVDPTKTQTSVGFGINVADPDQVGAITKIELLHGNDAPIVAEHVDVRAFSNLLSNNVYTLRVTYEYDLNDGKGKQTLTVTKDIQTEAKTVPTVLVSSAEVTQTSVNFALSITDPDQVGAITKIELLHGNDTPVVANSLDVRSFVDLLSNNEYTVRITYIYNLNDGIGDHTLTLTKVIHTQAKATPGLTVSSSSSTQDSVTFVLTETDIDNVGAITKIELLLNGVVVQTKMAEEALHFENLTPLTEYQIIIYYQYDLNDGNGIHSFTATRYQYSGLNRSQGLEVTNGVITGIGSCTDKVLYVDQSIGQGSFSNNTNITGVYIGTGAQEISALAFENCNRLTTVVISDTVTVIRSAAFRNCSRLAEIILPDKLTKLGNFAFFGCVKLKSVDVPNGVTEIEERTFVGCTELKSVTLGNNVESIGAGAFSGCSELENINLPDSLRKIGESAFSGCERLKSINIPNGVTVIENLTFNDCKSLITVTIPDSVITIEDSAFFQCAGLTSITIPDSVEIIGNSAFSWCTGLTTVTIPKKVEFISRSMFYNCTGLESVSIPDGVTEIGEYAFYGCSRLKSVTIPTGVTVIEESTFQGCKSLTTVTIPDSVTVIGNSAFYGCSSLSSIIIPDKVTEIARCAFTDCSKLESINIPNGVRKIEYGVFLNCKSLSRVELPNSVYIIEDCAFSNCSSLTSIAIPGSVKIIGNHAFYYCEKLTSVTIPTDVTEIGKYAFCSCNALTTVTIPDSVTIIGDYAFSCCADLTKIIYQGTKEEWQSIIKGYDWDNPSGEYTVECIDITLTQEEANS